jgi:uncharacterized protein (TIGR02596 family)
MDRDLLTHPARRRPLQAFTLIELLIVVAIMGILLTLAVSHASGGMEGMKMRQALETTRSAMEHARQVAMTSNQAVMFRVYEMKDSFGKPAWRTMEHGVAEAVTDPADPAYKTPGAQGYTPGFKRLGSIEKLPDGIIVHPSATFSSLLGTNAALLTGTDDSQDGQLRKYIAWIYLPDGRCSLPADQAWTLTLVKEDTVGTNLPDNYVTLELDPRTARVRAYRP